MKEHESNFTELKKLLKLKQHEVPPPGYFNNFSSNVIAQIRDDKVSARGSAYEQLQSHSPWLARFLAIFESRPSIIGAAATGLCLLLVLGVVLTEKSDKASSNPVVAGVGSAEASAMSLVGAAPLLADAGGGIQVSTNPISLQPMTTFAGQQNPLLQSASFGH